VSEPQTSKIEEETKKMANNLQQTSAANRNTIGWASPGELHLINCAVLLSVSWFVNNARNCSTETCLNSF